MTATTHSSAFGDAEGLAVACLPGIAPPGAMPGLRNVAPDDLLAGSGRGVVLMHPSVIAVARALGEASADAGPDAVLAAWRAEMRALLEGYRPRRARLMLLDVARAGDEAVVARLGLRLGLAAPDRPAAALLLAAARLIAADAEARALATELDVAMIAAPLPDEAALVAETCAMAEEVALLRAIASAQDAEIERLGRARIAAALNLTAPGQRRGPDPASLRALERRVAELEAELAGIYGSRSWRLTAPLRGARRALGR